MENGVRRIKALRDDAAGGVGNPLLEREGGKKPMFAQVLLWGISVTMQLSS